MNPNLANSRAGRILLNALCIMRRPVNWRFHWQHIKPELTDSLNRNSMNTLNHYLLGMLASAMQSGSHASKAYVGLAIAHAATDKIPALNLTALGVVFGVSFLYEIFDWIEDHPLSALVPKADGGLKMGDGPVTPDSLTH